MKHFYCLCMMAIVLVSCGKSPDQDTPEQKPTVPTQFRVKAIAASSVNEYAIYIYNKGGKLVTKAEGITAATESSQISVPYLEEMKAILVANGASSTTGTDSLKYLTVSVGEKCTNDIFVSDIVAFKSDAADKEVAFNLNRVVGKASFVPTETTAEINAVAAFDKVSVSFKNLVVAFMPGAPKEEQYITKDVVTIDTDKAKGFEASIYCFPNTGVKLALEYFKSNVSVNSTKNDLPESGMEIKVSVNARVEMSLYESFYLNNKFTTKSSAQSPAVKVNYVEL